MDRDTRNILNLKQPNLFSHGAVSIDGMSDGQITISKGSNQQIDLSLKKDGRIHKTNMSSDGNQYVDKDLKVNGNIISNGNLQLNNIPIFEAYSTGQTDLAVYTTVPQIQFASENIDNTNSFASHDFVVPLRGYYHLYYNISFNQIDTGMTSAIIAMRIGAVDGVYFNVTRLDDKDY